MKLTKKQDLILTSILHRLTDFQMQSTDDELFEWCEELREYIVKFDDQNEVDEIKRKYQTMLRTRRRCK